jgi:hypothetical protein
MEKAVVSLRKLHPTWGPHKLHRRLLDLGRQSLPAVSTFARILRREGCIAVPARLPFPEYDLGELVRTVKTKGEITFLNRSFYVGQAFIGLPLALRPMASSGIYRVCFSSFSLGLIDLSSPSHLPIAAIAAGPVAAAGKGKPAPDGAGADGPAGGAGEVAVSLQRRGAAGGVPECGEDAAGVLAGETENAEGRRLNTEHLMLRGGAFLQGRTLRAPAVRAPANHAAGARPGAPLREESRYFRV